MAIIVARMTDLEGDLISARMYIIWYIIIVDVEAVPFSLGQQVHLLTNHCMFTRCFSFDVQ